MRCELHNALIIKKKVMEVTEKLLRLAICSYIFARTLLMNEVLVGEQCGAKASNDFSCVCFISDISVGIPSRMSGMCRVNQDTCTSGHVMKRSSLCFGIYTGNMLAPLMWLRIALHPSLLAADCFFFSSSSRSMEIQRLGPDTAVCE